MKDIKRTQETIILYYFGIKEAKNLINIIIWYWLAQQYLIIIFIYRKVSDIHRCRITVWSSLQMCSLDTHWYPWTERAWCTWWRPMANALICLLLLLRSRGQHAEWYGWRPPLAYAARGIYWQWNNARHVHLITLKRKWLKRLPGCPGYLVPSPYSIPFFGCSIIELRPQQRFCFLLFFF